MVLIEINGTNAVVRKSAILTKGLVGATVAFRFDENWDGLSKTAVFHQGDVVKDCPLFNDTAVIPWEVMQVIGIPVSVGVYGASADGTVVIPTIWAKTAPVRDGADPSGDESVDPTLPVWQTILNRLDGVSAGDVVKTVNGVAPDKNGNVDVTGSVGADGKTPFIGENGNWWIGDTDTGVQAQGEKGDPGEPGSQGPAGPQGEKGEKGEKGSDGKTPVKGTDYWTDADKQEIVDDVLDAIPDAGGSGELRYCADCHAVTEGGSYYIDANTLNRPDDVTTGTLFVERVPKSSGIDTNLTLNDSGTILRCAYSSSAGTWDEWEWENPPYKFSKVYRTTERFKGHPVYAVNIACGMAVHGGTQVTLSAGIVGDPEFEACHNEWTVVGYEGSMYDAVYSGYPDGNWTDKVGEYPLWSAFSSIKAMWSANGLTLNFSYKDSSFANTMEGDTYITVKFIKKETY